jgi:hypothetical protein
MDQLARQVAALTGDTRHLVNLAMSGYITMSVAARAASIVRSRGDGAVIAAAHALGMPDGRTAEPRPRRRFARRMRPSRAA